MTPAGNPEEEEMPETPVVECVIEVMAELTQTEGELEAAPTVRLALTETVVAAEVVEQPTPPETTTVYEPAALAV